MVDINTTPLIDVMLVLLIMLIITIPIQTHAVKLNMPVGNPPPPLTPPEVVTIDLDFDGTVYWDGEWFPTGDAWRRACAGAAASPTSRRSTCARTSWSTYKYVAEVMASAQRIGVQKIGLVGNEQFL